MWFWVECTCLVRVFVRMFWKCLSGFVKVWRVVIWMFRVGWDGCIGKVLELSVMMRKLRFGFCVLWCR